MSQYATLTAAIQQVIKQNGNNEITGNILQQTLLSMVTSLGAYYQFAGVAVPATNPGTPDQRVCYIAGPGTYPNFGATVVPGGSIGIFAYNSAWVYTVMSISQVVDNLTTADATKSLSAKQGVVLDGKIRDANTNIGIDLFELCKLGDGWQVAGTGTNVNPSETLNGYYSLSTRQWVSNSSFTFRKFQLQAGKYYKILNKPQGATGSDIASLVLFRNGVPVHIGRYADNEIFYIQTKEFDVIGLSSASSTVTQFDSATFNLPNGSVQTAAIADGAVTNQKIADAAVGGSKLQDGGVTIDKIAFKTTIYGTNRLDPNAVSAGYINVNTGAFVANSDRLATDFIPVSTNGLYCYITNWYGNVGKAAVYDANKQFLRGLDSPAYIYQEGDAYVRWTIDNRYLSSSYVIEGTQPGTYVPYTPPKQVINQENIPEIGTENIADGAVTSQKLAPGISFPATLPAISLCGKDAAKTVAASLAAGANLQITTFPQYLKANGIVSFFGKLSAFDEIFVGFGIGGTNSIQAKIDATNVTIYKSGAAWSGRVYPHGLTISDFIDVTFDNDMLHPKFVVATKDGIFVQEMPKFVSLESYGYPAVVLGAGTTITNAELRATSDKFNKPIWVVGDSYMSLYDERWTYQMIKTIGIDNFLILGLAGGGSSGMYSDLQRALNFGTPKFLLWCLGMNDTYNAWKATYDNVVALCAANGIELVLETIPIPNLSSSDQQVAIDNFVRSSGHKYIDAAAAMSPNSSYPWYPGYETDGVHPTVLGAKVLAARFLSDFPEFMQ